jgi:hypothetical protein
MVSTHHKFAEGQRETLPFLSKDSPTVAMNVFLFPSPKSVKGAPLI